MLQELTMPDGEEVTRIVCDFCNRPIQLELNRFAVSLVNESLDFCDQECYGKFLDYQKAKLIANRHSSKRKADV